MNADFTRNTTHARVVKEGVEDLNLLFTWETYPIDFTCTTERDGNTFTSVLDHIFISEQLASSVLDAGVIHHPENSSDHEPVYCIMNSIALSPSSIQEAAHQSRPSCKKASLKEKELHEIILNLKLGAIMIPSQLSECKDLHCKKEEHIEAVDWFAAEIMEAIQLAGEETLPYPGDRSEGKKKFHKVTPEFNESVKPFKELSFFWHQVWKSAGCPMSTELHKIMKRTRNTYHR